MLLERRDRERGVELAQTPLTRTDKFLLLQDIAFWLIRNGWSDAPADRVAAQVARSLLQLHKVSAEPPDVFRDLMERSGLLREPAAGRVDFVHRTFQEYLAAKAAIDNDEIGQLRADVERLAERLVPPATNEAAEALAGAGEMLLDLLRAKPPRTRAEAAASIRAASRIGGQAALLLIGDILARHAEEVRSRVDDEVIGAWRFFKPDLYVQEVLERSWPPEKELQIPDAAFAEVLHLFPGLRAVRCELRKYRAGAASLNLSSLTRNLQLRSVALTGCDEDLDLTPLLQLNALERLELAALHRPPGLAVLGAVRSEWMLTLVSPACGDRLHELATLHTLTWLHLRGGDDLSDLSALPPRPRSVRGLSLYGFPSLTRLDGIGQWEGLTTIELFDCPQLTGFAPLTSLTSVEHMSLGLLSEGSRDLSPLTSLPRLKTLSLRGQNTFDVSSLAGIRDLVITVPPRARVTGADRLGPMSRITDSEYIDFAAESQ